MKPQAAGTNGNNPRRPKTATSKSTIGRPRRLSDAQITAILEWHKNHKSLKQVAREHGVSVNTIQYVVRTNGTYKQCSPEERAATRARRDRVIANLKAHCVL